MKEYGFEEIQMMQQKALERVKAMNLQAQKAVDAENAETDASEVVRKPDFNPTKGHIQMPVNLPKKEEPQATPEAGSSEATNFLDNIFDEPDKALLLSLLLLFKGDKANEELMTALIYIML